MGRLRTDVREAPEQLAAQFAEQRAIVCENFFEPALLDLILRRCRETAFVRQRVDGLGHREVEAEPSAGPVIRMVLARAELFRWLEALTGCDALGEVEGEMTQARADAPDHSLSWHNDLGEPRRRLAFSINFSDAPFDGGTFELRDRRTREMLITHQHVEPGSALIFAIGPTLEHRVLPITSGGPRRVFAGWFNA